MSAESEHPSDELETDSDVEALLYDAASVLTVGERERFLAFACRNEPAILNRVRSLIAMSSSANDFFEFEPQVEAGELQANPSPVEGVGVDVGRYRLIERIGSGGCGVVYLAEQREPVRRKVALKIIRLGLENTESIARFEAERQALASMNHANIARILDAGTTESGRPYYVMELVDGEAITDFCDSHRMGIQKRMELFLDVCRAIQHAHQKSVVHRDIKPSNILIESIEDTPVPKVIDFGIAGNVGLSDANIEGNETGLTGTPVYMSPEQVTGEVLIDTRSDVYSLGVLLGELVVGAYTHLPTNLMDRGFENARHIMLNTDVDLPSVVLVSRSKEVQTRIARERDVSVERLFAWCQNELDWVVGKAVSRDPSQRYQTVEALAADLIRWLHNEPVAARPQTRRYRLAKLVNRNRLWFGAGALAFVGLVGGFGVATVLFFRERDARAVQEKLRFQAEAAHDAEKHARTGWENRSRVAESAVRLRYQDFASAENLVATIPIEETPASLEAVSVFRELADWHRNEGRMERAEKYFLSMVHALANIDRAHTDSNSDNFLPASTALALSSNPERYESLRRIALDLYGDTKNRLVAERTLKACLLKPASDDELKRMKLLVELIEGPAADESARAIENRNLGEWEYFAISLFHYRQGDDDLAELWARYGLSRKNIDPTCEPAKKAVMGLTLRRQGKTHEAKEFLTSAAQIAGSRLRGNPSHGGMATGFWWDWINVRILLQEAGWSEDKGWRE